MTYTYYGHSCFSLNINNKIILVDPFIRYNPLSNHIDFSAIKADYIFVSHGHEDHIADCIDLAKQTAATVVAAWEITAWLNKNGIEKTHPMNTGGAWQFDFGKVKCVVAQHSSSLPDGSYGGNPMGFIFYTNEGDVYYTGDTALTMDMQLVPKFCNLKTVILPIGDNFTMGIADAITCMQMLHCHTAIAVHYDTFGYIKVDHSQAQNLFSDHQIDLKMIGIGDSYEI